MANAFQFRSLLGMGPLSSPSEPDALSSHPACEDGQSPVARSNRSVKVRENLDVLMRQIEHARHDADQMLEEMSALEVDASQTSMLRRENAGLREKLEETGREVIVEASRAENAARETARLKDEVERIRQDFEKSTREANANALDAQRIEDRLRACIASLDETKRDLDIQREAKEKAEVDAACLRANLTERDRAQNTLMQQETELRMQVAKLQGQYDDVTDTLARKERHVLETSSELEAAKNRIADLEGDADAARDEIRGFNSKYSALKVSQETRLFSLNEALTNERESHRMTRKLLEEARAGTDDVSDENTSLKDDAMRNSRESQKLKRELCATRSQLHEYSDKLKEAHLQVASAQNDIGRLEGALESAKMDAVALRRQADKSDQLLSENTDLNDKVSRMQQNLDRHRSNALSDEGPIMLSSAKRDTLPTAQISEAPGVATSNHAGGRSQNVARIRRR